MVSGRLCHDVYPARGRDLAGDVSVLRAVGRVYSLAELRQSDCEDLVWFGDPETIRARIRWLRDECKVSHVLLFMHFGGLEHEKVMKSMELFATQVMPEFR